MTPPSLKNYFEMQHDCLATRIMIPSEIKNFFREVLCIPYLLSFS